MLIPGPDLQGCRHLARGNVEKRPIRELGRKPCGDFAEGDGRQLAAPGRRPCPPAAQLAGLLRASFHPSSASCTIPRLWPGGAVGGSAQLRDHSHAPLTLYFIGTLSWAVTVIAAAVALSQAGARRTNGSGRSDCTTFWTSLSEGPPSRNGNRPLTPRVGSVDCWAGGPLS
jgi:hypothetical protein